VQRSLARDGSLDAAIPALCTSLSRRGAMPGPGQGWLACASKNSDVLSQKKSHPALLRSLGPATLYTLIRLYAYTLIRLYAYTLIRVPSPGLLYPLVTGRYGGALATAAPFSLRTFPPALPSAVRIRQSCSAGPASSLNARPKATGYLVRPGRLPAHASSLAAGPPRPAGEQCQNRNRRLPVCQHGRRHACPWCRPFSVQHGYGYGRRRLFF